MRSREEIDRQAAHDKEATYTSKLELEVLLDIREILATESIGEYKVRDYISKRVENELTTLREKAKAVVEEIDEANTLGALMHPDTALIRNLRDELRRQGVIS